MRRVVFGSTEDKGKVKLCVIEPDEYGGYREVTTVELPLADAIALGGEITTRAEQVRDEHGQL